MIFTLILKVTTCSRSSDSIINTPILMATFSDNRVERSLKIIGGKYRHRLINFYAHPGLRPTSNRTRETLFNWLQSDIDGATVLDLFAGSGALGFEALSRGAHEVVMVEDQHLVSQQLIKNIRALDTSQIQVINQDAIAYLNATTTLQYDIIFLDPPFNQGLIEQSCKLLQRNHWTKPSSLIYLETERRLELPPLPEMWDILKSKATHEVSYYLIRAQNNSAILMP